MVKRCFIIFACLALGHMTVWLTGIKFPASIIGMLLLTLALQFKVVRLESIKGLTDFLISNMGFFFVPPGVALMLYFGVLRAEAVPILVATVVSTVLVLVSTGWAYRLVKKSNISKTLIRKIKGNGVV